MNMLGTHAVHMTFDYWLYDNADYMGSTLHWIDASWTLQSCVGDLDELNEEDAFSTTISLDGMIDQWEIGPKLFAITSDNAALCCKLVGDMTENETYKTQLCHVRCCAHTIQLAIQDVVPISLRDGFDVEPERLPALEQRLSPGHDMEVRQMLKAMNSVVSFFKVYPKNTSHLNDIAKSLGLNEPKPFIESCLTWWGFTYQMICRYLENVDILHVFAAQQSERVTMTPLNERQIDLAKQLKDALSAPFQFADLLGSQNTVTSSSVIPAWLSLTKFLDNLPDTNIFKAPLLASVARRSMAYLHAKPWILAMCLDPDYAELRQPEHLELLKEEWSALASVALPDLLNPELEPKRVVKISAILRLDLRVPQVGDAESPLQPTPPTELEDYLSIPNLPSEQTVLQFWKANEHRFPKLAKMARKYLAMTATSTPCERAFSVAGYYWSRAMDNVVPNETLKTVAYLHLCRHFKCN